MRMACKSKRATAPAFKSPPSQLLSKRSSAHKFTCPICDDAIEDCSTKARGHDAVFCDGHCNTWLHRGCAGLSKTAFKKVTESNDPFFCTRCYLSQHKEELIALRTTVDKMASELGSLRSALKEIAGKVTPSTVSLQNVSQGPGPSAVDSPAPGSALPVHIQFSSSRKFNVILHGLGESPKGTPRYARLNSDFSKVSSLLQSIDPNSRSPPSVRDCRRLGKFNESLNRPRPVLVTLNSTAEVNNVLYNRRQLTSPVYIKPDLSPAERKIQSLLLKERHKLLDSGSNPTPVRI